MNEDRKSLVGVRAANEELREQVRQLQRSAEAAATRAMLFERHAREYGEELTRVRTELQVLKSSLLTVESKTCEHHKAALKTSEIVNLHRYQEKS